MKVRRLLLCLLLSVALTVTFIPSIAFADGTGPDGEFYLESECDQFYLSDGPAELCVEALVEDDEENVVDVTSETDFQWFFSDDDGDNWEIIEGENQDTMTVYEPGDYKCEGTYKGVQEWKLFNVYDEEEPEEGLSLEYDPDQPLFDGSTELEVTASFDGDDVTSECDFQWLFSDDDGDSWAEMEGKDQNNITVNAPGDYKCVVTYGDYEEEAEFFVYEEDDPDEEILDLEYDDEFYLNDGPAEMTVTALADAEDVTGECDFQWYVWDEDKDDWDLLPNADKNYLTVNEPGDYRCEVIYGDLSSEAVITVYEEEGPEEWLYLDYEENQELVNGTAELAVTALVENGEGDEVDVTNETDFKWYVWDEDKDDWNLLSEEYESSITVYDPGEYKCIASYDDMENDAYFTVYEEGEGPDDPEREVVGISLEHEGKYTTKIGVFDHPEFEEGDLLTVEYKSEEGENEIVEYTYSYDDEDECYYFISEDGDYIDPEEDLDWVEPEDVEGLKVGDTCTFYLFYDDKCCGVKAEIIDNPVKGISFTPVKPLQLVEGIDGYNDHDDDDQSLFIYDFPGFEQGDTLKVTTNDKIIEYVFDDWEEEFVNSSDPQDTIDPDEVEFSTDQESEWKAGESHEFTMEYEGAQTKVPFKIVANPIKSVAFTASKQHEVYFNVTGYEEEGYFEYAPEFIDGDKITLTYTNGQTATFTYYEDEGIFTNGSDELNWSWLDIDTDQGERDLNIGDTFNMAVTYMAKTSNNVPVKVVKAPVTKVELKPVDKQHTVAVVADPEDIDDYGLSDFLLDGDQLIVTMNGNPKAYTWDSYEREFISEDGDCLEWDYLDFFVSNADWTDVEADGWAVKLSYMGVESNWMDITLISEDQDVQNRIDEAKADLKAIENLDPAKVTLDDARAIYAAEDAYDFLNALIGDMEPSEWEEYGLDNFDLSAFDQKLHGANGLLAKIGSLEDEAEAADRANQKAANGAIDQIKGLPAVDAITLSDAKAVQAAKAAYDALKDKAYVGKVYVEKLNAAVAKIQKLQAQATYNKQVAAAKALSVNGLKVKAKKGKKANVTWKANKKASGYVIQYSLKKNFKKGVKTVKINKATTKKKLVKKLKAKKTYYFRIAAVSKVKNPTTGKMETYQGKWSKAKKIKAKK